MSLVRGGGCASAGSAGGARLAVVTEIPAPYRLPLLRQLERRLGDRLGVFFLGRTERRRQWPVDPGAFGFRHHFVPGVALQRAAGVPFFVNPTLGRALARFSPHVVVIGAWHHPSALLALAACRSTGAAAVVWCESTSSEPRRLAALRAAYKRWFLARVAGAIVPGRAARAYLRGLGLEDTRIVEAPNAVDNARLAAAAASARARHRARRRAGAPPVALFAGRLVRAKGVDVLAAAAQALGAEGVKVRVEFVGDGPGRRALERAAACGAPIRLGGTQLPAEMPARYGAADFLVLPARYEVWGFVVNEAMACGLPVICTPAVGAATELVVPGETGLLCRPGDVASLAAAIAELAGSGGRCEAMGSKARARAFSLSPARAAEGFVEALKRFAAVKTARPVAERLVAAEAGR